MVSRRDLVRTGFGASLAAALGAGAGGPAAAEGQGEGVIKGGKFDESTVRKLARALSKKPYKAPPHKLPEAIDHLTFDQYRGIRFRPERALWYRDNLKFQVQFFPRGFLYRERVDIFEVIDGQAREVPYDSDMFTYQDSSLKRPESLGFAGLKFLTFINTPGVMEEFTVFLGASYFRAVAKGQVYGLSARGFANGTGDPKGEEFAIFRSFWIQKPSPGVDALVLYALLDSPSVVGAFRFTMRPGDMTVFDVQTTFYPRKDIDQSGIAALTGMFYFDTNDHNHVDDWRPAAHDSEALSVWTGDDQQIWRPLRNPVDLQYSDFLTTAPAGFGLMQRKRAFADYQDLALNYEKRPSAWIQPIGDWGDGAVDLVEIPTPSEVNDNIVAFWRPKGPMVAGNEYSYVYRIFWGWDNPRSTKLARVAATRVGEVTDHKEARFFCIDFFGDAVANLPADANLHLISSATSGDIRNVVLEPNPFIRGWRTTFEFYPDKEPLVELKCALANSQGPISEQWVYRWTA